MTKTVDYTLQETRYEEGPVALRYAVRLMVDGKVYGARHLVARCELETIVGSLTMIREGARDLLERKIRNATGVHLTFSGFATTTYHTEQQEMDELEATALILASAKERVPPP